MWLVKGIAAQVSNLLRLATICCGFSCSSWISSCLPHRLSRTHLVPAEMHFEWRRLWLLCVWTGACASRCQNPPHYQSLPKRLSSGSLREKSKIVLLLAVGLSYQVIFHVFKLGYQFLGQRLYGITICIGIFILELFFSKCFQ